MRLYMNNKSNADESCRGRSGAYKYIIFLRGVFTVAQRFHVE